MKYGIAVDSTVYNLAVGVKRRARVVSSNISGMLMDNTYYNDVIGTFYDYDIQVAIPIGQETNYALFYEAITGASSSHTFVLPYNNTTITITGRIEGVQDSYVRSVGTGKNLWRSISFTILSNSPSKTPT